MRISAIFLSLNLIASLPVAAQAADEAISDKGDWLKRNLAALDAEKKGTARKVSLSDAGLGRPVKTPRVRGFAPNRYLPRRSDLVLTAQQARLDTSTSAAPANHKRLVPGDGVPLAGQVTAFLSQSQPPAPINTPARVQHYPAGRGYQQATRLPAPTAPLTVPGQVPTLPGQVSAAVAPQPAVPVIPEPPAAGTTALAAAATTASRVEIPLPRVAGSADRGEGSNLSGERLIKQSGALLVQMPVLTPDEQAMMDELVELNRPGRAPAFVDIDGQIHGLSPANSPQFAHQPTAEQSPHGQAGPPPFPLSLLPEDALTDLIKRGHRPRSDAPPAYFGSWHQPIAYNNLPRAGFHSYIAGRQRPDCFSRYAPIARGSNAIVSTRHSAPRARASRRPPVHRASSQHELARPAEPKILVYPPYQSHLRLSMF